MSIWKKFSLVDWLLFAISWIPIFLFAIIIFYVQSFWKDIHLFFLPNCVLFIVDWYQRLRCFWQMTHRHLYWKIRSKSISLALKKFRIKVDVIANVDRQYNRKMHLLPYWRRYDFFTAREKCNRQTCLIIKYSSYFNV